MSRDVCVPLGTAKIIDSALLGASTGLQCEIQTPEQDREEAPVV